MNATDAIAKIIVDGALEFMANKAGVTTDLIASVIAADPRGNTARYFYSLLAAGITAAPVILRNAARGEVTA